MKRCEIRLLRKACVDCHGRRAHFQYAGRVKWDRQHNLCFQCFRSVRNRARSVMLASDRDSDFGPAFPIALVASAEAEFLPGGPVWSGQILFREVEPVSSI
jgi:hypothetical protein